MGPRSIFCRLNNWSHQLIPLNYVFLLASVMAALASGCGTGITADPGFSDTLNIRGQVHGGQKPVIGADVRLYVASSDGDDSNATSLLPQSFKTDINGQFAISASYVCRSPDSHVYLVAEVEDPADVSRNVKSTVRLMASLGLCGNLSHVPVVSVNELTTVATLWPLASYAKSATEIGSASSDGEDFDAAWETVGHLVSVASGASLDLTLANGESATPTLNTLANIIAGCVGSRGGSAIESSPCDQLFSATTAPGVAAPSDTVTAALDIAQNPSHNVVGLFELSLAGGHFQPILPNPPPSWSLAFRRILSAPTISPSTPTLVSGQTVTLADDARGSVIYYTMDGSIPSTSSTLYSEPFPLTKSTMVSAVAAKGSLRSIIVSQIFKVILPISLTLTPNSVILSQSQTQAFEATVANSSNSAVTWALAPAVGSISASGIYSAPATIASAQTVTVTATSTADSTKTATATISLVPPVGISLTPGTATLGQSQSQAFAATMANSTNPAVTWTLTPAVGSISASGLYTAPASIAVAQTLTLTATSAEDPARAATAIISLVPAVAISLNPKSVNLGQSQTQAFAATVANSTNSAVTWTVVPAVGSISVSGLYTAPATIAAAQTVTVIATSAADSTKTATATISLEPPVAVSLIPGSVTLGRSQTQAFTATVSNSSNTDVAWALTPAVGTISASGLYSAPVSIAATQTVTVTATSVGDPSKTATATISLAPSVTVSITPTSVTLGQSQTQAFAAIIANSSNTAVTWTLTPAVGSLSATGLYTAPATIATGQTVTVTATSLADSTRAASAVINLVSQPAKLQFLSEPSDTLIGTAISPSVTVAIEDSTGNALPNSVGTVTLSLSGPGGLVGTLSTTTHNGIAVFSNLELSQPGSGYTLTASSSTLESTTSTTFTVSAPVSANPVLAASADSFVDSVGLNVHFGYTGSIYTTQTPMLLSAISQLNIRHVRDQMLWDGPNSSASKFYSTHHQLGLMGVKTDFILTSINYPLSEIAIFPSLVTDMEAAEPSNEYDASGDSDWVTHIIAQQAQLYSQMKGTPATSSLTIVAASLAQPENAPQLGDIASTSDVGDSHAYFGGWNPGNDGIGKNNTTYFMKKAAINVPSKPVWVTETGFWSQQAMYFGGAGNGEALMATYAPRALLDFWNSGAQRTYLYELADFESSDSFGLIRMDGTIKPAFYAISNLLALLKEPGASFSPGTLSYNLTGSTSQIDQALFQKSDGSFYLVLWIESSGMNVNSLANIRVPDQSVTVNLNRFPKAVTSYQWNATGSVVTAPLPVTQAIPISVGPNITVLKLE